MSKSNYPSFIYIADTHIGTDKMGYFQQTPYEKRLSELFNALNIWISENDDIDYIIHGGDMVNACTQDNIKLAVDMFSVFDIPVKLSLGNHDLTAKNSVELWLKHAPCFFENNSPYFILGSPLYTLHLAPNNWNDTPLFWESIQDSNYSDDTITLLHTNLEKHSNTAQILITHNPVFGVPPEQTTLDAPLHPGTELLTKQICSIADAHDSLKIILGAHTHMNMHVTHNQTRYVTVSSFPEAPFEFKHFKLNETGWRMKTHNLGKYIDFRFDYDFNKTYVQGRPADRSF